MYYSEGSATQSHRKTDLYNMPVHATTIYRQTEVQTRSTLDADERSVSCPGHVTQER